MADRGVHRVDRAGFGLRRRHRRHHGARRRRGRGAPAGRNADALQHVAEFVAARTDPAAVAAFVSREVAQLFGADAGGVVRFDDDGARRGRRVAVRRRRTAVARGRHDDRPRPGRTPSRRSTAPAGRAAAPAQGPQRAAAGAHRARRGADPRRRPRLGRAHDRVGRRPASCRRAEARLARFAELVALAIAEREARDELQWRVAQQAAVNELSALALGGGGFETCCAPRSTRVARVLDVADGVDRRGARRRRRAWSAPSAGESAATHVGLRFRRRPTR